MAITLTTSAQVIGSESNNGWRAELLAWYDGQSGNNATVHVALRITFIDSRYSSWYGTNKGYTLNFNGTSSDSYSPEMFKDSPVWVVERTQTLSGGSNIYPSGGWYCYSYSDISVGISDSVVLPAFIVAPNVPTVSVSNNDPYANQITFGTTSWGNPNSGTVYLYGGTSPNPTTQLTSKNTLGNSTYTHTGLSPNTTYYYRARAKNASAWSNYSLTISITTKRAVFVPYPNNPAESNTTKLAKKLEGSLNGLARKVLKLYDSSDGKARRIY